MLFDYFRVPYEQLESSDPTPDASRSDWQLGLLQSTADSERQLLWARFSGPGSPGPGVAGAFQLDRISIVGHLCVDSEAEHLLSETGGGWKKTQVIRTGGGAAVASIWRDRRGRVFLPFDPNELIRLFWSEGYLDYLGSQRSRRARSVALRSYYRIRPAIPRALQIAARRIYSRVQSKQTFPRWPVETSLHDLYDYLFDLVAAVAGEPVPFLAPWPQGYKWAFVLTHDVEGPDGYGLVPALRDIEVEAGYRSSWNFVPNNHEVAKDAVFDELRADGFEIGVHGLYHDGRDIADIAERLPHIRRYAEDWQAVGFRSPATLRDRDVMANLPFVYDSSYSDTAPYEPQPGGSCSWLPYMIGDVVELPITLPQDHTLFEILGGFDERLWIKKARLVRARGGMALVLTHPDYAENQRLLDAYSELLHEFAGDDKAWKALPRAVSAWWLRRAASHLVRDGAGWKITGPAADGGTVMLVSQEESPASREMLPADKR